MIMYKFLHKRVCKVCIHRVKRKKVGNDKTSNKNVDMAYVHILICYL
jgi:hypothetical protein